MSEMLNCVRCGDEYEISRWRALKADRLRRERCKPCADRLPPPIRTVANLHKSNGVLITDLKDLVGINQKGGLVK